MNQRSELAVQTPWLEHGLVRDRGRAVLVFAPSERLLDILGLSYLDYVETKAHLSGMPLQYAHSLRSAEPGGAQAPLEPAASHHHCRAPTFRVVMEPDAGQSGCSRHNPKKVPHRITCKKLVVSTSAVPRS